MSRSRDGAGQQDRADHPQIPPFLGQISGYRAIFLPSTQHVLCWLCFLCYKDQSHHGWTKWLLSVLVVRNLPDPTMSFPVLYVPLPAFTTWLTNDFYNWNTNFF